MSLPVFSSACGGTILFDREAGRVVESRERVERTGDLTRSAQGQDRRVGFDLTMRIEVQFQPAGKSRRPAGDRTGTGGGLPNRGGG